MIDAVIYGYGTWKNESNYGNEEADGGGGKRGVSESMYITTAMRWRSKPQTTACVRAFSNQIDNHALLIQVR